MYKMSRYGNGKKDMLSVITIYIRINPGRFHYLKFILEAYDNLAVLSSFDQKQGVVRLRFPEELASELFDLLASISGELT